MGRTRIKKGTSNWFQSLVYPVHEVPENEDLFKRFPTLKACEPLYKFKHKELDRDKVVKAIIYAFDKNSDLIHAFSRIDERRATACQEAGLSPNDINWQNPVMIELVLAYLHFQGEEKYILLIATETAYWECIRRLNTPLKDDSRSKDKDDFYTINQMPDAVNTAEKLANKIRELKEEIYGSNTDIREAEKTKLESAYQQGAAEKISKMLF